MYIRQRTFVVVFSLAIVTGTASAEGLSGLDVSVKPTASNAPISLVSCEPSGSTLTIRVGNRSTHTLSSVTYRLRAYDSAGARFNDSPFVQSVALATGEVGVFSAPLSLQADESRVVCSLEGAAFDGTTTWSTGQSWHGGKLVALEYNGAAATRPTRIVKLSAVRSEADKAWVTNVYGTQYVHVRTKLTAHRDVTVTASEFRAILTLGEGAQRVLPALTGAAPTVTRQSSLTPFGQIVPAINQFGGAGSTTHPAVKPSEDLGAIGALHLESGAQIETVITFQLTGGVDPSKLQRLDVTWEPSGTQ
jgi:hypothetical protein